MGKAELKLDMMVTGINAKDENVMEIEVANIVETKEMLKVTDFLKGNLSDIQKAVDQNKQYRSKLYLPREWCSKIAILPFQHVQIDIKTIKNSVVKDI